MPIDMQVTAGGFGSCTVTLWPDTVAGAGFAPTRALSVRGTPIFAGKWTTAGPGPGLPAGHLVVELQRQRGPVAHDAGGDDGRRPVDTSGFPGSGDGDAAAATRLLASPSQASPDPEICPTLRCDARAADCARAAPRHGHARADDSGVPGRQALHGADGECRARLLAERPDCGSSAQRRAWPLLSAPAAWCRTA